MVLVSEALRHSNKSITPAIVINGNVLDLDEHGTRLLGSGSNSSGHILIRTSSFLEDEDNRNLRELHVGIEEYISENVYLCHYDGNFDPIRKLPFVEDVFEYPPRLKIEKGLMDAPANPSLAAEPPTVVIHIVLHQNTDPLDVVRRKISQAAHVGEGEVRVGRRDARVDVKKEYLEAIANIPDVRDIHEVHPVKLDSNEARQTMSVDRARNLNGTLYKGAEEIIAVADTGLDLDHPAFFSRIAGSQNAHGIGDVVDRHGHGTHVSGSVLGNGPILGKEIIQGIAPEAKLLVQSLMVWDQQKGENQFRPDMLFHYADYLEWAYKSGARVHTNSWNSNIKLMGYTFRSRQIDDFVWKHPDMVICYAAGNDSKSIGNEAASKNCVTVGATEDRADDLTQCEEKYWWGNRYGQDRTKPDVFAPGKQILSARSRHCAFLHYGDHHWRRDTGTSMANALVAGCAAVLREALRGYSTSPSAALIKALLICGADTLTSHRGPIKRVNLANSVHMSQTRSFEESTLGKGHEYHFPITTIDEPATLIATLVWTDPAGSGIQNKLELAVETASRREINATNDNVLQVQMKRPSKHAKIIIRADRIGDTRQPFACTWRWVK